MTDPIKIFYSKSSELRQTLEGIPDQIVTIREGKERMAKGYLERAGHCLIATGADTRSSRLSAVYSDTPTLGVSFCPIVTKDKEEAKALTVWLNSVLTWLMLLNLRSGVKLTFPNWSHTMLRQIRLPDPDQCNLTPLLTCFEAIKHDVVGRLDSYLECPVREKIDQAAAEVAGISWSDVKEWRDVLAKEPTIARNIPGNSQ